MSSSYERLRKRPARTKARKGLPTDRQLTALDLRRQGLCYTDIAKRLGIAPPSAYELVQRALFTFVTEAAAEVAILESDRLDTALASIWERVERGDLPAIDRLIKIQERRAKLVGIDKQRDAPAVVAVSDGPDVSRLSPAELRTHFELMAKCAKTDEERARYEAAAAALEQR